MFPVGKIKIRILIAGRLNKQRDEGMIKTEIRGQRSEVGKGQKSEIREEKCWNAGIEELKVTTSFNSEFLNYDF